MKNCAIYLLSSNMEMTLAAIIAVLRCKWLFDLIIWYHRTSCFHSGSANQWITTLAEYQSHLGVWVTSCSGTKPQRAQFSFPGWGIAICRSPQVIPECNQDTYLWRFMWLCCLYPLLITFPGLPVACFLPVCNTLLNFA